jgi:hypothetical protein
MSIRFQVSPVRVNSSTRRRSRATST